MTYRVRVSCFRVRQCIRCKSYALYYDNENILFEGEYLNGWRNGKGKKYHYNGELQFEGEYFDGEINGKTKEYYDNSIPKFEGEYLKGKKN